MEVRRDKMPRCYMVKKGRHETSLASPSEASVAPSCSRYQPVVVDVGTSQHEEVTHVNSTSDVLKNTDAQDDEGPDLSESSNNVVQNNNGIGDERRPERSAEDRQAAQDLLSLSQGLPSSPQQTVITVLQPRQSFLISYTLQPTGIYILTDRPQTAVIPTTVSMQSNYIAPAASIAIRPTVNELPPPPSPPAQATQLRRLAPAPSVPQAKSVKYNCSECGRIYATSSNLSRHKQTHRSLNSGDAKRCMVCGKTYVSMPALAMHEMTHNMGHSCSICGKQFSRPWLLRGHVRSHTGEKPYTCAFCGKAFADRSNFRAHLQTHSTDKMFRCHRCGRSFALKSYLNKHVDSSFCVQRDNE